jgi:hypothetical protein
VTATRLVRGRRLTAEAKGGDLRLLLGPPVGVRNVHFLDITSEAWNRCETYSLGRLDRGVELPEATGVKNGRVHGDIFPISLSAERPKSWP